MKSKIERYLAMAAALAALVVGSWSYAQKQETRYGHVIPPFKDVFVKLCALDLSIMSQDQLDKMVGALSEKERGAIGDFLGEDGSKKVNAGLPKDRQAWLNKNFPRSGKAEGESDFQPIYPNVITVINNLLALDQLQKALGSLSSEDLASQSLFLGEDGRRYLFSKISQDKTQAILDRTGDWVFIETGKRKYKSISQYMCTFYKQERVGGKWQDRETILMKYREKPKGIYMKWQAGPYTGRELLYNETILGTGKVRVRESGLLGVIAVTIPIDSELAKRGTNHLCTEVGLKYLLTMIENDFIKGGPKGEIGRKNYGIVDLDGNKVYKMESIMPQDPKKGYYCYRIVHYIDYIRSLEIKAEIYNFKNEIQEIYYYTDIKLNPGLPDQDFDPANPKYGLK